MSADKKEIEFATPLDAYHAALAIADYQAKAYENGYRAGMTRAAEICDKMDAESYPDKKLFGDDFAIAILRARDGE